MRLSRLSRLSRHSRLSRLWQLLLLIPVALGAAGCAYRTPAVHAPDGLPPPVIVSSGDVEVVVHGRDPDSSETGAETTARVRRDAAAILHEAWSTRTRGGEATRARARVRVDVREQRNITHALREDGIAFFGMWPVAFGMDEDHAELSVDVAIDTPRGTLTGHGSAEKYGSLFAHARRRALAVALDQALADAAKQAALRGVSPSGG